MKARPIHKSHELSRFNHIAVMPIHIIPPAHPAAEQWIEITYISVTDADKDWLGGSKQRSCHPQKLTDKTSMELMFWQGQKGSEKQLKNLFRCRLLFANII